MHDYACLRWSIRSRGTDQKWYIGQTYCSEHAAWVPCWSRQTVHWILWTSPRDTFRWLSISSCLDWLAMATAKAITPFVLGVCYAIRGVFEISTVALMQLVRYVATLVTSKWPITNTTCKIMDHNEYSFILLQIGRFPVVLLHNSFRSSGDETFVLYWTIILGLLLLWPIHWSTWQ